MTEITATVASIKKESHLDREKKILELDLNEREKLYVEFQSKIVERIDHINVNDKVLLRFWFNGKKSKLGKFYNNLIGKSIKKID